MRGDSNGYERSLWGKQGMRQVALPRRRGPCLRDGWPSTPFPSRTEQVETAMRQEDLAQARGRSSLSVRRELDNGTSY